ncbi:MAG: cytochrome c, partial [Thermoleophilia bacterium]|nr:cytochrome c [Thermoleophilia bacterium]
GGGGATGTGPGGVPAAYLASCEACHPDGGRREGSGPRLAGQGWDAARIRRSIDEGIGTMPGGLLDGAQAAEVTRYVRGLQRPEPPVTTR